MGRAEVNLRQIGIGQENLKSIIQQFREKLGNSEKEKMGLRKQVESLVGDIGLLERNLGEKEVELGKFEVEMRRVYGELGDKSRFAEETWDQMRELNKRADAESNCLQVDYDQQEARTQQLKQDLVSCQADYELLKRESGEIYLALNNKEQELSELREYNKKMKGNIKDFRKRYKKETQGAERTFRDKNNIIANLESKLQESTKLVTQAYGANVARSMVMDGQDKESSPNFN
jgi:chromosome segregation ATPase